MSKLGHAGHPTDRLVRRFAALAEGAGDSPDVATFLSAYPKASIRERADVMLIDLARRVSSDEAVGVEEYLSADAEVAADDEVMLELIVAEHDFRTRSGNEPEIADFAGRFPARADSIRGVLSQRTDEDRLPAYPQMIRQIFELRLTPATAWGTLLGATTGFAGAAPPVGIRRKGGGSGSFLAECRPFSRLPLPVVRLIESEMRIVNFDVGEYLMREGDPGTSLMVLCDGEVEISTDDEEGRRRALTQTNEVQVLGEMALLTDQPRSANVVALAPVRTLSLPAERFHELAGRFPEISVVLTLLLAERLGVSDRDDVLAGKTLGSYRIGRRLERGGMSVVYDARHVETLQHVALKMMSHRLVYDQDALDQFQQEADIIQSFEHRNIVHLIERFTAFHTYFIVMEFADGITLRDRIDQTGPLPEAEFRQVFGQIASALGYAHDAGVIHRDVKPANIMLTAEGIVKLMDFGLATPTLEAAAAESDRIVGTPRYMSPEQLVGGQLTREADLFSLGCVGYEMLTGEPLIAESDILELLRRHANWQVPDMGRACPGLSRDIGRIVEQCLSFAPPERRLELDTLKKWETSPSRKQGHERRL